MSSHSEKPRLPHGHLPRYYPRHPWQHPWRFLGHYVLEILLAIDQLFNAITGGWSDETFSSRCYRNRGNPVWNIVRLGINLVFFWQEDHCHTAYLNELSKKHWPDEMR